MSDQNNEETDRGQVLLARPLLCLTRAEIEDYCEERRLEFRVDRSNVDLDFARNRIRHVVMPALRELNAKATQAIARAAEITRAGDHAIDVAAQAALEYAKVESITIQTTPLVSAYLVKAFMNQPSAIRRRMIIQALRGCQPHLQITGVHLEAVESLLTNRRSGRRVTLPGNVEIWRDFETVRLQPANDGLSYRLDLGPGSNSVEAAGWIVSVERAVEAQLRPALIDEAKALRVRTGQNWLMAVLDEEKVPQLMVVRPRVPGERAEVQGHGRRKKLKKLMIDHRIPASSRSSWPVVAGTESCYIWSPGLPPSSGASARGSSKALAVFRARPAGR